MTILSHDEFFAQLAEIFNNGKNKDHGALFLSQKSYSHGRAKDVCKPGEGEGEADLMEFPEPDAHPDPLPILIRVSNGKSKESRAKKVKLSTLVDPEALDAFYARYADACKAGMAALKPRDRTKRKAKAKKKKVGAGQTSMTAIA